MNDPLSTARYIGGMQLLLKQWQHFHGILQQDGPRMPAEARQSFVFIFEHLLAVASTTLVPESASLVWTTAEPIFRQWIARYGQATATIGDFRSDAQSITTAMNQVIRQIAGV